MDSQTQLTVDVITKVSEGKITINNATKLLSCSRRTIERYQKCKPLIFVNNLKKNMMSFYYLKIITKLMKNGKMRVKKLAIKTSGKTKTSIL